jgi:hypothetical protein
MYETKNETNRCLVAGGETPVATILTFRLTGGESAVRPRRWRQAPDSKRLTRLTFY